MARASKGDAWRPAALDNGDLALLIELTREKLQWTRQGFRYTSINDGDAKQVQDKLDNLGALQMQLVKIVAKLETLRLQLKGKSLL